MSIIKNNRKFLLSLFIISGITFTVFSPSLNNGFVNWDDNIYVTENPIIRNLSIQTIRTIFTNFYSANYHPLTLLSYTIEYSIFKLDPRGYHRTNLILHLLNTFLVYWMIYLISNSNICSMIVALLFGIHPLHVESVVWIAERKDVLYSFFFLGSIISYIYFINSKTKGIVPKISVTNFYTISFILFLLSLLSKPMAITLPLVLFLIDYLMDRKFGVRLILEKIPLILLSVIFGIISIYAQKSFHAFKLEYSLKILDNLFNAIYGIVFYLIKIIVPDKLSCIYPAPAKMHGLYSYIFKSAPFILIILILIIMWLSKYKKIFWGIIFFIVTVLPVLQLIPIGQAVPADRYMYIPAIGLFYIFANIFNIIYQKRNKHIKPILIILIFLIISTFSYLSFKRCYVWKDSITLWNDVLSKYPNVSTAYLNRGLAYGDNGDYDKAVEDYKKAIIYDAMSADAYNNLGNIYFFRNELDLALINYNKAIDIFLKTGVPNIELAKVYNNRGNIYARKNLFDNSIADFNRAIELNQYYSDAYFNRANVYYKLKKFYNAISDYNQVIKINPYDIKAYKNRAICYFLTEDYEKAYEDICKIQNLGYSSDPILTDIITKLKRIKK